ncbi:MAG: DNA translocase FtsK 4TM domain-containing protein [Candidatus Kapabacteria bacterium]|nr:DNA translocase FtsK 4TM domain-containing protein [Candidatus Kapabacteria bacterium]
MLETSEASKNAFDEKNNLSSADNKSNKKYTFQKKIIAMLLFSFSILLLIALITFTSADEANTDVSLGDIFGIYTGNSSAQLKIDTTSNLLGIIGAVASHFIFVKTLGFSMIFVPIILCIWAIFIFKNKSISEKLIKRTVFYFLGSISFAALAALIRIIWMPDMSKEWSGIIGQFLAVSISGLIGKFFSFILITAAMLASTWFFFNINFNKTREFIEKMINKVKLFYKKESVKLKENAESVINEIKPKSDITTTNAKIETVESVKSETPIATEIESKQFIQEAQADLIPAPDITERPKIQSNESDRSSSLSETSTNQNYYSNNDEPLPSRFISNRTTNFNAKVIFKKEEAKEFNPETYFDSSSSIISPYGNYRTDTKDTKPAPIPSNSRDGIFSEKPILLKDKVAEQKVQTPINLNNDKSEGNIIPEIPSEPADNLNSNDYVLTKHTFVEPFKKIEKTGDISLHSSAPVKPINDVLLKVESENSKFITGPKINNIPQTKILDEIKNSALNLPEIDARKELKFQNDPNVILLDHLKIIKTAPVHTLDDEPEVVTPAPLLPEPKPILIVRTNRPESPLSVALYDEEINYQYPQIDLLSEPSVENVINDEELQMNARILQEKLETFKISIENLNVTPGPVVTQYEFTPAAGIKISRIESLADDLAMALKAKGIRIIAPIPGKGTVGIEIPNSNPSMVTFTDIASSTKFMTTTNKLPLGFGKTISGEVFITDLTKMPHLLVAGSTGSGKSVGINTVITSLIFRMHPKNLKFVIIDPKKVELQQYSRLQNHFMAASPDLEDIIITNPKDAVVILKATVLEMEMRYDILAKVGQRNINEYNIKVKEGKFEADTELLHRPMPFIVVIIDELADLMLTAGKEIEEPITRLAQMARAVGIHLIIATQRPSVDVITGIIKANFPARIAYLVASKIDSRTILDVMGAEQLLGNGDMLFLPNGTPKPIRIQNAFISTEEVEAICDFIGDQDGYSQPYLLPTLSDKKGANISDGSDWGDRDPLFEEAARMVIRMQMASVSMIQRKLKVGYARAGRIVDELEAAGVVGPADGSKARIVIMDSEMHLEAVL